MLFPIVAATVLHSHRQRTRIPTSAHPHQHLFLSSFLKIVAMLMGVRRHLIMAGDIVFRKCNSLLSLLSFVPRATYFCAGAEQGRAPQVTQR